MANWYGHARSNYFKVKDETAFKAWVGALDLGYWESHKGFAIYSTCPDSGGWPSSVYNEETEECEDFDIFTELAKHLEDDQVAVLMGVGAEELCYLTGNAVAVRSNGDCLSLSLSDIYQLVAEEWGADKVTAAAY